MKPRKEILQRVLEAPNLGQRIARLVREGQGDEQTLREQARRYLLEITADYRPRWIPVWEKVLSLLWRAIYDDFVVDGEGLAKIREISRQMPFVIIPCHRSHADYLLISYILYRQGIPLPFVAAGDNMDFWPFGYIFRQSGAFFLRRSFQGDDLYTEVFTSYVETLLKERVPLEFFVEGGRSRTGKMVMPKFGMISILIRAYQDKASADLALIPLYIGYDRIIEEDSYCRELQGMAKTQESLLDVLRHSVIMLRRYGRVYLQVGNPLFLSSYFAAQRQPLTELTGADRQTHNREIALRMVAEINRVAVVTPVSLGAASLLCRGDKDVARPALATAFATLYDYLSFRKVNLAPALAARQRALAQVLKLFGQWGYLGQLRAGEERPGMGGTQHIAEEKRLHLEYYKNGIVHHFLPVSLTALSILTSRGEAIDSGRIRDDCRFLKKLFRREFLFGEDGEVPEALSYLEGRGVIECDGEKAVLVKGRAVLAVFAGLLGSYLEAYWAVVNAFPPAGNTLQDGRELLNYVGQSAREMYGRGAIVRAEALSREYFKSALSFLQEEGMLTLPATRGRERGSGGFPILFEENRMENLRLRLSPFIKDGTAYFLRPME